MPSQPQPKNNINLDALLAAGAQELKLALPKAALAKMLGFTSLLEKWNKVYNLTAIHSPEEIIVRHILDSLAVAPYIKGKNVLDVGSGAGLPGIPLALALPNLQFTLLDSQIKKTRFLRQAALSLAIKNIEVVAERVERFHPQQCFATIVTRATYSIKDILAKTEHLLGAQIQLLIMKGKYPEVELAELDEKYRIAVHRLKVPCLNAERHLVTVNQ